MRRERESQVVFLLYSFWVFVLGGVAGWMVRMMVKG